jgi:hypothetical protein
MVEIFFGIITRQAIRRSTFTSVTDLEDAIRDFIDALQPPRQALHLDQERQRTTHQNQPQTKLGDGTLTQ